ncbi:MAG: phasin family protein [Bacteroidales bacterium]
MEKLEELFKKFVYTGVGLISLTKDKLEKTIDDLIKEEKISTKEGEKIVNEFLKNTETKKTELEEYLRKIIDKAVSKIKFASAKDLEDLEKRVKQLEDLLKKQ